MKKILSLTLLSLVFYLMSFAILFEVFGLPTRTHNDWLGPKLRFDQSYIDIGGVYEYQQKPTYFHLAFHPLCRAWLITNDLH